MAPTVVPASELERFAPQALLPRGALLAFPTDTVYGLGARVADVEAVAALRTLKARSAPAPFSLHVGTLDEALTRCAPLSPTQTRWVSQLLPGPYTVLFPAGTRSPQDATYEGKVGVRVPDSAAFRRVFERFGPLLGTSVNRPSALPLNDPDAINSAFGASIAVLITAVDPGSGHSSSVIDLCGDRPHAVRGALPRHFER